MVVFEFLLRVMQSSLEFLNESSLWLVMSFVLAGLLHNFLSPDGMHRVLGNTRVSSLLRATVSGMLLPICSCGVIPLGIGLYYSGAFLGPTLSFMAATPMINPAALLLAYGLLGPQIATVYLVVGFIAPMLLGVLGNCLGGTELHAPGMEDAGERVQLEAENRVGMGRRLISGMAWGFTDLGVQVSRYVIWGMLLAGLFTAVVPSSFIVSYLGDPGMISIAGIAVLGAVLYVCAVGHIPFIAALVACGASPGAAITFLMAGAATNLPELISIYKLIGKRTALVYGIGLTVLAMVCGYLTNQLLLPGFKPFMDLSHTQGTINLANKLVLATPEPIRYLCSAAIVGLFFYAYVPKAWTWLALEGRNAGGVE